MSEKPEALRLAQELDVAALGIRGCLEALSAAELRRLHAENERLRGLLLRIREWDYIDWKREIYEALQEVPR